MTNQENATRSFVQEKLSSFADQVSGGFSRPVAKFVKEMLFGLCGTGSASVFNIAKHIRDTVSTKKTSERLYRNLRREGLDLQLQQALLNIVCPKIKADSLLIVDDSDIEKPYARKMQGLKKVHNGSKATQSMGYLLMDIVACLESDQGYKLLPVSSNLVSTDLELDSAKQLLQDRLVEINIKSKGKGIFVFDRGYDDRELIGFLVDNGMSFILRGMGNRNVFEHRVEHNFRHIVGQMEFQYELPGYKDNEVLLCATRKIGVRTDDHPSKGANSVEANLVVARRYKQGRQKGKDFYIICNFHDADLTAGEIVEKAVTAYNKRWKIEEVHRQMKQDFQWESMRLASYQGLKNLNTLLCLALYFVYSCQDWLAHIAESYCKLIYFRPQDRKNLLKFMYYRIASAIKACLGSARFYNKSPYRYDLIEPLQMKIRLV